VDLSSSKVKKKSNTNKDNASMYGVGIKHKYPGGGEGGGRNEADELLSRQGAKCSIRGIGAGKGKCLQGKSANVAEPVHDCQLSRASAGSGA